jgi:hypothetical protein
MHDEQDTTGVSLTNDQLAREAMGYSVSYLIVLFGALALDHWAMMTIAPELRSIAPAAMTAWVCK